MTSFRADLASRIVPVVLANVTTRYPYHEPVLFRKGDTPADPTDLHPAFGNSFDWHSSVHSHWTALRLWEYFATRRDVPQTMPSLCEAVVRNLSEENVAAESGFLAARSSYERPYGWAWALLLAAETATSSVEAVHRLHVALAALAERVATQTVRWLGVMPAPVRHGVHGNTAFALGIMRDAALRLRFDELKRAIDAKANQWFGSDRRYAGRWERSGNDFLSPGLAEADLMRRVLPAQALRSWWHSFLPDVRENEAMFAQVEVPKVSDGGIVHLHGLNLSRAGMLARIAAALATGPDGKLLLEAALRLYRASEAEAYGNEYLSTHWLPTFAWDAASSLDTIEDTP